MTRPAQCPHPDDCLVEKESRCLLPPLDNIIATGPHQEAFLRQTTHILWGYIRGQTGQAPCGLIIYGVENTLCVRL